MNRQRFDVVRRSVGPGDVPRLRAEGQLAIRYLQMVVGPEPVGAWLEIDEEDSARGPAVALVWTTSEPPREYSIRCHLALLMFSAAWAHMDETARTVTRDALRQLEEFLEARGGHHE